MKKKLLFLYPYKFTNFEYFKFEIEKYKKLKFKILVSDLSKILLSASFYNEWKSKRSKEATTPSSFIEFYRYLKKNKKNLLIINFIQHHYSFKSIVIFLIIKILKIKQIHIFDEGKYYKSKKKIFLIKWILAKIKEHKFNLNVFFFYLNFFISKSIIKIIRKNDIFFSNLKSSNKNIKLINFFDYSNSLNRKIVNTTIKNYCLYIDNGGPYFKGDTNLKGNTLPNYNINKIYTDIIYFFKKIQSDFKCKVIIIPHPKYKSFKKNFSLNPYFSKFIVDNRPNALSILTNKAKFLLAKGSTANSYAVIYRKPIINFYSGDHKYGSDEIETIFEQAKLTGNKALNIKKYSKKLFAKKIRISKNIYDKFLFSALTKKSIKNLPNYRIISDYIIKYKI